MGEHAVHLAGIHKRYGGRVILDGIDLAVARGEFFALLGPSGSGKSTLLKMVSGIDAPDSGQVHLAGRDVTAVPSYRRPVHTVFQNYALFPHLDVAGNVAFPLKIAGVPRDERTRRVLEALAWVKMQTFATQRVDRLSGGERQRVALARALVGRPEVVLLDEPLSALDPHLRGQTLELLQEIQGRLHATYLYITHDREEALRAAHRIGVLNLGHLEQVGTPEELYHAPATPFVAGFVGPVNWLRGRRAGTTLHLDAGSTIPLVPQTTEHSRGELVLPSLRSENVRAGERVLLGIRPEHVRIGDGGFLSARVVQRQFAGASVHLRLEGEGGLDLAAEVGGDRRTAAVGESVGVSWPPERAFLFEDKAP